jgi:hypothetical protein
MTLQHPVFSRRVALQAGAIGLIGLGANHVWALDAAEVPAGVRPLREKARACIYIFLSGGLAQHDSFDLKPDAPREIRGDFRPIETMTPGVAICEHLPLLAQRSRHWSLLRSLTHPSNDHTVSHYFMLTGRSVVSPGFVGDRKPRPTDWPSIAAVAGRAVGARSDHLPPAVVLPERLIHWSGGVIPGAYAGQMGESHDPWFIEASPYGNPFWHGAYPEYTFPNETKNPPGAPDSRRFQAPSLSLPEGLSVFRLHGRAGLLAHIDAQRRSWEAAAETEPFDRHREAAISLLVDPKVRDAFDVTNAAGTIQDRYGRNSFGWSLLMAFRLVQAGVGLVQVNLGNNETWDTHGDAFPRLKDKLLPPTDKALSALLDDLVATGLLDSTLVVMAGEFGRTPKLSTLPKSYEGPGRDHWGGVQTVFFAGGGTQGGRVIGASDRIGAFPASSPQRPENLAATIFDALGIPATAVWRDALDRPHAIYHGQPITALT